MAAEAQHFDAIVVGGGVIGTSIAYGLRGRGLRTVVLDEGDRAFRAARGNFGLVWIQSKGNKYLPYARLSRQSADLWPDFAKELVAVSGQDVGLRHDGGFYLCMSEAEWNARSALMQRMFDGALPVANAYEMMERGRLDSILHGLGNKVVGACYCRFDAAINPLRFLKAVHASYAADGGIYRPGNRVVRIAPHAGDFEVTTATDIFRSQKIVLAAGLGNIELAAMVGLEAPVRPLRGHILVTQKLPPKLNFPTHTIRQLEEGGFILGDSREDVGFDDGTELGVMGHIARRAAEAFPFLGDVQLLRAWAGLRTMTSDGMPFYLQSESCPEAYLVSAHSGITLAPLHARVAARAIAEQHLESDFPEFQKVRNEISKASEGRPAPRECDAQRAVSRVH
jgi:glycine/D-amino acid oxidase-like deaminating enzyme